MKKLTSSARKIATGATIALLLAWSSPVFAAYFRFVDQVDAFDTELWTVRASAGVTRVIVDGDRDTDLDCFVYDRFGQLLGSDTDGTDYCVVDINQVRAGTIWVVIKNLGNVYNQFTLSLE